MKKQNKRKEALFMNGKMTLFIALLFAMTMCFILEKWLNVKYLAVQRDIQDGILTNWRDYLTLGCVIAIISAAMCVFQVFLSMWTEQVQKIGFFKDFNGLIQEDGMLQPATKVFTIAAAKISCIPVIIKTIIGVIYTIIVVDMVKMDATHYIGGLVIFCAAIVLGCYRGKLQAKTDMLGAETQSLQQKLSNFYMISDGVLDERLKDIKGNYRDRMKLQCIKMVTQQLPAVAKVAILVMLFYNATAISNVEIRTIYSTFCLVASAYVGVVEIANSVSEMLEYITKISNFKKETEVREIKKLREKRKREVMLNQNAIKVIDDGLLITTAFTVSFRKSRGTEAHYNLDRELNISAEKVPLIIGDNGTGKSVFCKMLRDAAPNTICYDVKTGVVEAFYQNLVYKKNELDFDLLQRLAAGLDIDRIPEDLKEFEEYKFNSPNSADRQMMCLLQILYISNMESRNGARPLIILDEVFANLSANKMQKVLPFIFNEIRNCSAMALIVSHGFQEELKEYVNVIWKLETNDKNEVTIVEELV
ncbi:MAG: hypothetical protein J6J36_07320 [Clostridia bacterium]|nr:hypothetical protein [Clostridia bacterium]